MGRTNLFVLLSSLSCSVFVQGSPQRISAQDLAGLLREYGDEDVRIVDFRSDFERETRGYLKGSELVPNVSILNVEDREKLRHIEGDERIVVAMASPGDAVDKAKRTLRSLGHKNFFCYIEDLDILKKKSGGLTTYPRFIKFNALSSLLSTDSVLLIDVRNRTELNTVGAIPGSVCVPLHEVDVAMDEQQMSDRDFMERYGFERPSRERQDIVLTCRSGRRVLVADSIMRSVGFNKLRIYRGSFKDWVKNNGTVYNENFDMDYEVLQ